MASTVQRFLQLTLDLFGDSAAPRSRKIESKPGFRQFPQGFDAIDDVAIRGAKPRPRPLRPAAPPDAARFAHPQANRRAVLGGQVIDYAFRRARRRSIGFTIGQDGLVVSAPRWVPLAEVDAALVAKADWIVRKLAQSHERQQRLHATRIVWADGCLLPYLGGALCVVLDPTHGFAGTAHLEPAADAAAPATLRIGLPSHADAQQIRDATQAWLMRQARNVFTARLDHFAPLLGVRWTRLRLSSAATRWGSASADGSIRLNWRLIHLTPAIVDYVVAHELSHLRVMDHSPRFWDTVATVLPDYADLRRSLRHDAVPLWE